MSVQIYAFFVNVKCLDFGRLRIVNEAASRGVTSLKCLLLTKNEFNAPLIVTALYLYIIIYLS